MQRICVVNTSAKTSGGAQQLLGAAINLANANNVNLKVVNMLGEEKFFSTVAYLLFLLFQNMVSLLGLSHGRTTIIYSDPILSIFDILFSPRHAIRFIQSVDTELYNNHPRLNELSSNIIYHYIYCCTKFGRNKVLVNSKVGGDFVKSFRRESDFVMPFLDVSSPNIAAVKIAHPYFISVMSNPEQKGIETLLRVAREFPGEYFVILSQSAIYRQIPANVIVLTNIDRSKVLGWLKCAKAHLSFSVKESIGLPIYEAMALGVPSIFLRSAATDDIYNIGLPCLDAYSFQIFSAIIEKLESDDFRANLIHNQNSVVKEKFTIIDENILRSQC